MSDIEKKLRCITRYKYLIVFLLFVLIAGFIDELSLWQKFQKRRQIDRLEQEIADYRKQYARDSVRLRQLQQDPHEIVNIAREKYFMRAANEDVYVIEE